VVRVNPLKLIRPVGRVGGRPAGRVRAGAELRVGVAQLTAVASIGLVLAVDAHEIRGTQIPLGFAIVLSFALLRTLTSGYALAPSTLVLDAVGTAIVLAGTDAPASPMFFLALAGAWWAAHVQRRHTGAIYAGAFFAAYSLLVVPHAIQNHVLVLALEDLTIVAIVGVLSDWFVRVDRRAIELSETLARAPIGVEKLAIRDGLRRALGPMEIPLDVLLTAAREGFTVIQAELLAYLAMGLTNPEIADATKVSEATVRYRLTRLYRALGVRGRKAAVVRAHEIGLVPAELPNRHRHRT